MFGGFCLLFFVFAVPWYPRVGVRLFCQFDTGADQIVLIRIPPGLWSGLFLFGEFDSGSGRTLAACLTHASRTVRPFGVHEWRTGE